jgi:recombination protein RecR
MNYYPPSVVNLVTQISRLPGIGEKTAERLALHILKSSRADAEALSRGIMDVKLKTRICSLCFGLSDGEMCRICTDSRRNSEILCVVESFGDMVALEKAGAVDGLYLVLGGALSPIDGIGPDQLRVRQLMARIAENAVKEVVVATSTSVEGEATADYLSGLLKNRPVTVTRIASGVPMGGDLKFVDQVTLKKAMEARRAL